MSTNYRQGQRVRLLAMPNDPAPLPAGATGTIASVVEMGTWTQLVMAWDPPHQQRALSLCVPPDQAEVIQEDEDRRWLAEHVKGHLPEDPPNPLQDLNYDCGCPLCQLQGPETRTTAMPRLNPCSDAAKLDARISAAEQVVDLINGMIKAAGCGTYKEAAKRIGIRPQELSAIRRGRNVSVRMLCDICHGLGFELRIDARPQEKTP